MNRFNLSFVIEIIFFIISLLNYLKHIYYLFQQHQEIFELYNLNFSSLIQEIVEVPTPFAFSFCFFTQILILICQRIILQDYQILTHLIAFALYEAKEIVHPLSYQMLLLE